MESVPPHFTGNVFVLFHFAFCITVFFLRLGCGLEVLLLLVRRRVEEVVPAVFAGLLLIADKLWEAVV